ncbi:hypothetical protein HYW20_02745 [Candidatus Woesearchaeota archaeon]|nr:hypothetical protein [Candidatus Woesearchaeota archaeon]
MAKKDLSDYLKDPHIVAWIILGLFVVVVLVFFDYFKQYFLKIALIGILFMLFYFFDDFIFKPVGKSAKDIFSGNLFVKRWKAFPIFLLEIYVIYFLSTYIENWLSIYLSADKIQWWYVLVWIAIMYGFYWFKASRE